MARRRDAPTLEYILARKTEAEQGYRGQDAQIDTMRKARDRTFEVNLPDELTFVTGVSYKDPTIEDEQQRMSAQFTVNRPSLVVHGAKDTDSAQKNATKREKFTTSALMDVCGRRELGPSTLERIADMQCSDGGAWSKLVFQPESWRERYGLKRAEFKKKHGDDADRRFNEATEKAKQLAAQAGRGVPVDWVAVDSRTVYPQFEYGGRLTEVLEVQKRPLNATFRRYRLGLGAKNDIVPEDVAAPEWRKQVGANHTEVTWVQHWDEEWVTEVVAAGPNFGQQIVYQERHGLAQIPYCCSLSLVKGHERNRKIGSSISEPKRAIVEELSFLHTVADQIAIKEAIPPIFEELPPDGAQYYLGEDGKPLEPTRYDLGVKYRMPPGARLNVPSFPQVLGPLLQRIQHLEEAKEKLEPPRISGEGDNLQGAGFAIAQVLTDRNVRYASVLGALQDHLCQATRLLWMILRTKVKETVYVHQDGDKESGFVSVDPEEDLTDDVRIEWKINPEQPSAEIVKERYLASRVGNFSLSRDQMIERLGDNPDEVRLGIAIDEFRNSPLYKNALLAEVAALWGRGDLLTRQMQADRIAEMGMAQAPPQVAPAGPGGPQQVPDFAALAGSPNGAGMGPAPEIGPGPGGVSGVPQVPSQAGAALIGTMGT